MRQPSVFFTGLILLLTGLFLVSAGPVSAQAVQGLAVEDRASDGGDALIVSWNATGAPGEVVLERAAAASGPWEEVARIEGAEGRYVDNNGIENGQTYYYRVAGTANTVSAQAAASFFNAARFNLLIILLIFLGLILYFLQRAKAGGNLFIRKIAGLDALEEAIGRATEMGKPVLYVPGIDEATNIQTIYSMAILNSVSKMVAQYDTELIVPVAKAFVVPLAEETVRSGYMDVGRPDSFKADNIRYLSDEQFAFTAAVNGIMLREKPAANIYLGSFFAESLVLAETGFTTGAIQIAGTANIHQLPFFVVACDYTMIGEEFFATSAYMSREPMLVGTLKGTDVMKLVIMIFLIVGAIAQTLGSTWFFDVMAVR